MTFPTQPEAIQQRLEAVDPAAYAKTRNYLNGAVTRLSPYLSRGVLSTYDVMQHLQERRYQFYEVEKLLQELAWRDYWQWLWNLHGENINQDLLRLQPGVQHHQMPSAVLHAQLGIEVLDDAIHQLYGTGYIHNHLRLYLAGTICTIGKTHWHTPAQWMYYHLLDGDWASNALSWQWVAGTASSKPYFANQENINKYSGSTQRKTFLDADYSELTTAAAPLLFSKAEALSLQTHLPTTAMSAVDESLPTLLYTYYNLDPTWMADVKANRIFILEPHVFAKYPVSDRCIEFATALANNIEGIQIFTGSFASLQHRFPNNHFHFKQHPLNAYFSGEAHPRKTLAEPPQARCAFFPFWKHTVKQIKKEWPH